MIPDVTNKSAEEIFNMGVEKEKELQQANENLHAVVMEKLELSRQIINLQAKRKDLDLSEEKAAHIVKQLKLDISMLRTKGFSAR